MSAGHGRTLVKQERAKQAGQMHRSNNEIFGAGGLIGGLLLGPLALGIGLDWWAPTTLECRRPASCESECLPVCEVIESTMMLTDRRREVGAVQSAEAVTERWKFHEDLGRHRANVRLETAVGGDWLLFWWSEAWSPDDGHFKLAADINRYVASDKAEPFRATVKGQREPVLVLGGAAFVVVGMVSLWVLIQERRRRPF